MTDAYEEKRLQPRTATYLPIQLTSDHGERMETLLKDIGEGGLRCILCETPEPETRYSIEVVLPGDPQSLHLKAQQVWQRPLPQSAQCESGMRFEALDDVSKTALTRFLNERLTPAA